MTTRSRFSAFAWAVLGYNLMVILWGAYVRASGSGAGCGSHWPLCNGEIVPRTPATETVIEFTHRLSSGMAGVLVILLLIWAFRAFAPGHVVRKGAVLSLILMVLEGLVGAALVLFQWVASDASVGRAISIAVHLNNTLFLLAALTLTAWWASFGKPIRIRGQGSSVRLLGIGFLGLLLLSTAGALTALGDTLFKIGSLAEGVQRDFEATAHFLERLRILHPILAVVTGVYLILTSRIMSDRYSTPRIKFLAAALTMLILLQLLIGLINLYLLAPIWIQLIHLFFADLIWVCTVVLAAEILGDPEAERIAHTQKSS